VNARSNPTAGLSPLDPAVRSRITGVISGSAATRLVKTGPANLELTAANTYAGGTAVDQGILTVNNTTGSGTGSGPVIVSRGTLIGNGIIAPAAGNGVTVTAVTPSTAGNLITDSQFGTPGNLTVGTAGVNNPVTLNPGAGFGSRIQGTTFDPAGGPTSYGRLTVRGTGAITLTNAALSLGFSSTFTPAAGDVFGILDNQTAAPIVGSFNGIAQDGTVTVQRPDLTVAGTFRVSYSGNIAGSVVTSTGGNDLVLYSFTPVPEPTIVLAGTVIVGWVGRRICRRA
jgi:autotransporter-associated beta strand protein